MKKTNRILTILIFAFLYLPMLVLMLIFTGGMLLMIPLGLIALALGVVKACV